MIGDELVYNQSPPETPVDFATILDLDVEYPEAEYCLNMETSQVDPTRKWVRMMNRTIMNNQLFPIYTSMETMDISPHDITDEQLKTITFQVVPQFYWKYEWSFNDFMIHFVGRLEAPESEVEVYDMLGNVWEWVRDDWTGTIHQGTTKQNLMFGSVDGTNAKTIKGGAFDQFCRKTISPAREQLDWEEFRSQYATQANVGFRPSMIYTADGASSFAMGVDPVDLFFLFDASASQTSQIGAMLTSAQNIVKMFAGVGESRKNLCHVGSALFLGPRIRMMCGSLDNYDESTEPVFIRMPRPGKDGVTLVNDAWSREEQR